MENFLTGTVFLKKLNLLEILEMGSFLIIVVKLYSYVDSDVGNLQKSNIFTIILDTHVRCEIRFN